MTWTWATSAQMWVDGVTEGAADACTDAWDSPTMAVVSVGLALFEGQIAHCGVWDHVKPSAWWVAANANPGMHWGGAVHDWKMGDSYSDISGLTIRDAESGLNLTTTAMGSANILLDHP